MRVSTAGRYALRAMLDLALYGQDGPILRHEIADRQEISGEYIAQLFRQLTRAGLAHSVMGPGGGYQLALPADQISAGAILRAVEGPVAAVFCALDEGAGCPRKDHCAANVLWSGLTRVIEQYLDSVTLQSLCDLSRQLEQHPQDACLDPISALFQPFSTTPFCPEEFTI